MRVELGDRAQGPAGWARQIRVPDHPNNPGVVDGWFLRLPHQGIGWDSFMLAVVELIELPGYPPPNLQYPQAQFELTVQALSPEEEPRPEDASSWLPMQPPNFVRQFHGIDRRAAEGMARRLAQACVSGELPAETQMLVTLFGQEPRMMYIREVVDAWNRAIDQMIEHEQTGGLHSRVN